MFITLFRVNKRGTPNGEELYLTEVSINTEHILFMTQNSMLKEKLMEGKLNLDLEKTVNFTDLKLNNSSTITVIGDFPFIESKISKSKKTLLRG